MTKTGDTNLNAIHNFHDVVMLSQSIVADSTKILI